MGEMHNLDVGCADCTVIKTPSSTILVDCSGIDRYSSLLPPDKKIRAVFITHQHYDHFDGLAYLRDNRYSIEFLIYAPYTRRRDDNSVKYQEWQDFIALRDYFVQNGSKQYAPHRQDSFDQPWWKVDGVSFYILGPHPAVAGTTTRELHDACLVIHAKMGSRRSLFTGDASDSNLNQVANSTKNICDDILHASHHGSINGADIEFIKKCNAQYTVISTESGVHDNVPHPTAMRRYTDNTKGRVYRTDTDGSIKWTF